MSNPVDADEYKTQRIAQQLGPQLDQPRHKFAHRGYLRDLQVEYQQGDGDGEDAITKRFEAVGAQTSNLPVFTRLTHRSFLPRSVWKKLYSCVPESTHRWKTST